MHTSSCSHTPTYIHTPQWNALLFREWGSQENRVEVTVLKIQEPGSSPAVWAKKKKKKDHVAAVSVSVVN